MKMKLILVIVTFYTMFVLTLGTIRQPSVEAQLGLLSPSYSPAIAKPATYQSPTFLVVPGSSNYPTPNVYYPPTSGLTPQYNLPTGSAENTAAVGLRPLSGTFSGSTVGAHHSTHFGIQPSQSPFYSLFPSGQQTPQTVSQAATNRPTPAPQTSPPTKKSYSFRYWGQHFRPVVKVTPQQAVIPGTVPFTYAVQVPTGVKYTTYRRPAALAVKYNATKIQYEPVESHGYHISF